MLYALLTTSVIVALYSTTDKFNLILDNVIDVGVWSLTNELAIVSVCKSIFKFDPAISETGNNFLLNEPKIEGNIKPYTFTAGGTGTTAALPCRFDCSSNSIFSRITTNCNGGILEDFNKCNVYIPVLFDLTCSPIVRSSYYSFFGNYESIVQPTRTTSTITPVVADSATDPPTAVWAVTLATGTAGWTILS